MHPKNVLWATTSRHESLEDHLTQKKLSHYPLIKMNQVHGADFTFINKTSTNQIIDNVDAIITQEKNHVLAVKTADCLPILISHPSGIISAIHSGRKSTQLNILNGVLSALIKKTGSTCDYSVYFGPRICKPCYEINSETGEHFDLVEENVKQLNRTLGENNYALTTSPDCTSCQNDKYYSYRREGQEAGRFFSYIIMV